MSQVARPLVQICDARPGAEAGSEQAPVASRCRGPQRGTVLRSPSAGQQMWGSRQLHLRGSLVKLRARSHQAVLRVSGRVTSIAAFLGSLLD